MRRRFLDFRKGFLVPALAAILIGGAVCSAQTSTSNSQGGTIRGTVKSGNMPIPGVAVTAASPQSRQRVVAWTDVDGSYTIQVPEDGEYFVRTQMAAFAPAFARVSITPTNPVAKADLELTLQSRAPDVRQQFMQQMAAQGGRGFQTLSVTQGEGGSDSLSNSASADDTSSVSGAAGVASGNTATESVAVSGATENSGLAGLSGEEIDRRVQEMRDRMNEGGGFRGGEGAGFFGGGGPGGGGFGGGPGFAFGGFGRGGRLNINQPHGALFYSVADSIFNAAPYSLTGHPTSKPAYFQNRFGGSVGGPLNIPKIYKGGDKTFYFINYTGNVSRNPFDVFATVPTLAERNGDFSSTTLRSGPNSGLPVQIFDPRTNGVTPFTNSVIPPDRIDSAAAGLLAFIPLPNLPGDVQNYHRVTSSTNSSSDINVRINHMFGAPPTPRRTGGDRNGPGGGRGGRGGRSSRNSINVGFNYTTRDNAIVNVFPSIGGHTTTRGINANAGYTQAFGRVNNILRFNFNQNRTATRNLYTFSQNVTGNLGINGVSQNPFDWGLPGISLTSVNGFSDVTPRLRRDQTYSLSDFMIWSHGKHSLRWGGDFRWIQTNNKSNSNARGTFVFSNLNTSQGLRGGPTTGLDFADFLLGLPQQTSVQYGINSYQFRGNSWDLFLQDEWRVRGSLSLNLGIRYEYISPYTELDNRIANLLFTPNLAFVLPVLPGQANLPASLVRPDRDNFAPRIGIAWKATRKTVVRAGYSINYNTGQYSSIIQQLAFQPPFSFTQTNSQQTASSPTFTLQNGFFSSTPGVVTNSYAVDPNYNLGYVQIWNANVQQEITPSLIVNFDYTGTKGTRLDVVEAPNRNATGPLNPAVQPFLWETSDAASSAHAGSVRVRKRLQHGFSIGGSYTFSKSIDNASSIGGGGTVVAQDPNNLAGERGLSSFDQRHRFTADYMWELPFGHDRHWLTDNGILRDIFGDWQWNGDWTIASGPPFTPRIPNNSQDISRGTPGTLRPNVTGQSVSLPNPTVLEWFNTAAFVVPPNGQFGNARRNSIEGPGQIVFNMALTKIFPLKETRTLELRAQASNVFNTPHFTGLGTSLNSRNYGQITGVDPGMRAMQLSARFRF